MLVLNVFNGRGTELEMELVVVDRTETAVKVGGEVGGAFKVE